MNVKHIDRKKKILKTFLSIYLRKRVSRGDPDL